MRTFRGNNIGNSAITCIHEFTKENLLLRKIVLYVRADNISAINLYLKLGYNDVSNLKEHIKLDSGYINLKVMGIIL